MTTTTSFSSHTNRFSCLYKTFFKNLIPATITFSIIFFISLPLPVIISWVNNANYINSYDAFFDGTISIALMVITALMALVLSIFSNSYLYSKKQVDLFHSLPATRTELLSANLLASSVSIGLPLACNYFFTTILLGFATFGNSLVGPMTYLNNLLDIFIIILYAVTVYLFISFISTTVGTAFDSFASSIILGFSVMIFYMITGLVWSSNVYGAEFSPDSYVLLLSPFTALFYRFTLSGFRPYYDEPKEIGGLVILIVCSLAFAALLYWLNIVFYRKRKSETAEQAQANGIAQTLVKIVVAFLGASALYALFADNNLVVAFLAAIAGSLLTGAISEIILSRGVKSLGKNLKWIGGTGIAFCLLITAIQFDLTGFESRVPEDSTIESVSIDYTGRFATLTNTSAFYYNSMSTLTNPESIEVITRMHREIIANKPSDSAYIYDEYNYDYFRISYKLKNGSTIDRYYRYTYYEAAAIIFELENKADFIAQNSPLFVFDSPENSGKASLEQIYYSNSFRSQNIRASLNQSESQMLLEAVRTDMLNESLEGILNPSEPALGYIEFEYKLIGDEIIGNYELYSGRSDYPDRRATATVIVTPEYINTIEVMKKLNLYDNMVKTEVPDSVYIVKEDYWYRSSVTFANDGDAANHVLNYMDMYSNDKEGYEYNYSRIVTMTDEQSAVNAILKASKNQMLVTRNMTYSNDPNSNETKNCYQVVFCKDNRIIGTKMIFFRDLPDNIKKQVEEYNSQSHEAYEYEYVTRQTTVAETVTAAE